MTTLSKNQSIKYLLSILLLTLFLVSCLPLSNGLEDSRLTSTPSPGDLSATHTSTKTPMNSPTPSITPSPTKEPTPNITPIGGGGGLIAYVSEKNGAFNIYTIEVTSRDLIQLSFTEEYVENPFWSPDGRAIAFTGKVFTDNRYYQDQIFVVDIDTNEIVQITSGSQNIGPSWSPDGEKLSFLSRRDGSWALYTMDIDGSTSKKHTNGLAYIDQPYWAPIENIVILADRENIAADSEIIRIDLGQFGYQNITQNAADDLDPVWSPDGTRIAFISDRDGNTEIYIMETDGSNQTRITTTDDWELLPRWSPDGKMIAFQSNVNGNWDIYVINPDGSGLMRLTEHPAPDVSPSWSPDGNVIAFVTLRDADSWKNCQDTRDCNSEIYLKDLTSGELIRLTENAVADVSPAWQPYPK